MLRCMACAGLSEGPQMTFEFQSSIKSWIQKKGFSVSKNNLSYLKKKSVISLICDPKLYSFISSIVSVSLSSKLHDQENFTTLCLLSKFAFNIPQQHLPSLKYKPMTRKIRGVRSVPFDIGERQSATLSSCHTACVPRGAEGILNYMAAIPKPASSSEALSKPRDHSQY